uniref:LITAF domain-containing protein n=1 Tax=Caenorhabditis japonica TaxID=281687 RepID=A0A8R1IB71_CAEJA
MNFDIDDSKCEDCHGDKIQKTVSFFGMLAVYSLWWCGLGFVIAKITRTDYCENCFYVHFMGYKTFAKTFVLLVDDTPHEAPPMSLIDHPIEEKM